MRTVSLVLHLGSDATPEVGVQRARLQHGRHQRPVFRHQQVEHPGVGQQVVAVHELQRGHRRAVVEGKAGAATAWKNTWKTLSRSCSQKGCTSADSPGTILFFGTTINGAW